MNIAGIPNSIIEQAEKAQALSDYHYNILVEALIGFRCPNDLASTIASTVLDSWYEALNVLAVDDVKGVPLNVQMLPVGMDTHVWLPTLFGVGVVDTVFSTDNYLAIERAFNELRGILISDIFRGLDTNEGCDLAIVVTPSCFLVPANDITLEDPAPLRMFSTLEASKAYSDQGSEWGSE